MSLSLKHAMKTNIKKMKRKKLRTFFTVMPIAFMTFIIFVSTTLLGNFEGVVTSRIIEKIDQKLEIISLGEFQQGGLSGTVGLTESTRKTVESLDHVEGIYNVVSLPDQNQMTARVAKLGEDNFNVDIVYAGLPSEVASLYTDNDFTFDPEKPIPIVVTRNAITTTSEEWNGETKVEVVYSISEQGDSAPVVTSAVTTSEENLIGLEFNAIIGGIRDIESYTVSEQPEGRDYKEVYVRKSAAELERGLADKKAIIGEFWDFEKLRTGFRQQFVIVGVNEGFLDDNGYIPLEASLFLANKTHEIERSARNSTPLTYEALAYFSGAYMSDGKFVADQRRPDGVGSPAPSAVRTTIPGLILSMNGVETQDVSIDIKLETMIASSHKIVIDDARNREDVIDDINSKTDLRIFDESAKALFSQFTKFFYITLAVITGVMFSINLIIILLTLGRSVSDSRREIGVWRAIGATRRDVLKLFLAQSALTMLVSFVIGSITGWIAVYFLAGLLATAVAESSTEIVGVLINETFEVSRTDFLMPDWPVYGAYLLALLTVVLLLSLFPAQKAARISPIEAIRKAD